MLQVRTCQTLTMPIYVQYAFSRCIYVYLTENFFYKFKSKTHTFYTKDQPKATPTISYFDTIS